MIASSAGSGEKYYSDFEFIFINKIFCPFVKSIFNIIKLFKVKYANALQTHGFHVNNEGVGDIVLFLIIA